VADKNITAKKAGKVLKVSDRMVEKYIKKLKDNNYIERIGGNFGGYWTLK